jgi:hypothetical protein
MKKYILSVVIIVSCFSCKKELNLSDPTRKSTSNFYQTQVEIEQAVNGCYSNLQDVTGNEWIFAELPSDNTTIQINPADRGQTAYVEEYEYYNVTSSNGNIATLYSQTYNALYNINYALSKIPGITYSSDAKKNQYIGELEFLRAYHYFNLVQLIGDAVVVTQPLATASDAFNTTRSPVADVYKQIVADLIDAATKLPLKSQYTSTDIGRATKEAAWGLLGKVYLTEHDYKDAETTLRQILTLGYQLNANYADNFDPTKKNGTESLFEVQYQGNNNLGEASSFEYTFSPLNSAGAVTGFPASAPNGYNMPTRSVINEFESGDKRLSVSLQLGYTNASNNYVAIPYINKYVWPHTLIGQTNSNWPVLRYSDILLMLAETINEEGGPTGDAYSFLNMVRTRAGLAPVSGLDETSFRAAVSHERRVELCFENDRWFQLKRTMSVADLTSYLVTYGASERANPSITRSGVPFAPSDYQFKSYMLLFPIPYQQTFLDKKLTQNQGY